MNRRIHADLPISPIFPPRRRVLSPLQDWRVPYRHTLRPSLSGKLIRRGFLRGTYRARVRNLNFRTDIVVKSDIFQISGAKWKLALSHCVSNGRSRGLEVCLFSCNAEGILADTMFTVKSGGRIAPSVSDMMSRVAYPFQCIARHYVDLDHPMARRRNQQLSSTLTVTADLKNIQAATEDDLRPIRDRVRRIGVEIIDEYSIRRLLNTNRAFGIISPVRQQHYEVYSCSSLSLWAKQKPGVRYWLCQRSGHQNVIIHRCLNKMGIFSCFGNIEGNESIITLFEEKKNRNEDFESVNNDTVIIFVKLYEPSSDYKDLAYFGHVQAQKNSFFLDLQDRIEAKLPDLFGRNGCNVYLEEGHCLRDITNNRATLAECGIHSGSILIIRERAPNEMCSTREVQRALRSIHSADPELSEGSQIEWISHPASENNNNPLGPAARGSTRSVGRTCWMQPCSLPDIKLILLAAGACTISSLLGHASTRGAPSQSPPNWKSLSLNAAASAASFLLRRVLNLRRFCRMPDSSPFDWNLVFLGAGACSLSFVLGRASNSHQASSRTSLSVSLLPASNLMANSVVHGQHLNVDTIQALLLLCQASLASFASGQASSPELVLSVRVRRDAN